MRKMADRRLRLVLALSLAAFAVVVLRAAQIQVVDAAALSRKAVSQQRDVVTLPGLRGAILSADGQHLAQEQSSKTIVVDEGRLRHPHHAAVVIARALGYHELKKRHAPQAPQEAEVPAEPRVAGSRTGDRGSAAAAAGAGSCASSSPRWPLASRPSTCRASRPSPS